MAGFSFGYCVVDIIKNTVVWLKSLDELEDTLYRNSGH